MHHHPIFPIPSPLPRLFDNMTEITIGVPSTSDRNKHYTVTVETELKIVECDCLGFKFWGRCRHIRFLKGLIKDLMHDEK